jgi:hypothetical protein
MKATPAGYTGGEMMTMVAPLFDIEPDAIIHIAIIVLTDDGTLEAVGCEHAPMLAEMVVANESRSADNTRPHNGGTINQAIAAWIRRKTT